MSSLEELFAATTDTLLAELKRLRSAHSHGPTKGSGVEEAIRKLLRMHLPASVGVTSGQVADSKGSVSGQIDIILYDSARAPMIFRSSEDGSRIVPAEGVLACIEVKAHLTSSMLPGILQNCRSVKNLDRSAYIPQPIQTSYRVYERTWADMPVQYSVFALESDAMYAEKLNALHSGSALDQRIDTACYLDRGVNLNTALPDPNDPYNIQLSPTATSFGGLTDVSTRSALLVWFLALARQVLQAQCRPIDLTAYARDVLKLEGRLSGPVVQSVREDLLAAEERRKGMPPGTLTKLASQVGDAQGKPLNSGAIDLNALADLLEAGGSIGIVDKDGQERQADKSVLSPELLRRQHAVQQAQLPPTE